MARTRGGSVANAGSGSDVRDSGRSAAGCASRSNRSGSGMPAVRAEELDPESDGERRRRLIQGAGALILSLASPQIARGATLVGVRVWPAPDYTRLTLEHDAPLSFSHFMLRDPMRLVVDIDGLDLTPQLKELVGKVDAGDPYVALIRVGQNRANVVRMVIERK